MLHNKLILYEMAECSRTRKAEKKSIKINIILKLELILCYISTCLCVFSVLSVSDSILPYNTHNQKELH